MPEPSPNSNIEGLHVLVIGAGLAGLAAAISTKIANNSHQVTICEAVKELQEVGAGLQVTPNATRLFKTWGIHDSLAPYATSPVSLSVWRYDGTRQLAHEPDLQGQVGSRYGSPFWGLHRVDLQRIMVQRCRELGIEVRVNARVTDVAFDDATITLEDGSRVKGDVVVCADGLWSATRSRFLGKPSPAALTGDVAYRIVLDVDDLTGEHAEELRCFISGSTVNFWAGPDSHVVSYTMRRGKLLNVVLLRPDDLPAGIAKADADLDEMRRLFAGWDPLLRKLLGQVRAVQKWRLMWLDALPRWANREGTFFMAGDSCHPMLPYLAQGANSSLEDGAILGWLLGKVATAAEGTQGKVKANAKAKTHQLPRAADLYQRLRMSRGRQIQQESFAQRRDFHLPDGPAQAARDELMTTLLDRELPPDVDFPSRWTCPRRQRFLYGYDAYGEVEKLYEAEPF